MKSREKYKDCRQREKDKEGDRDKEKQHRVHSIII